MASAERQPLVRGAGTRRSLRHQLPTWTLLGTVCAAGIGGTFQYGYNISLINAPTQHIHNFLNETWHNRYRTELSSSMLTLLWSTIASIFSLGGFFGAHLGPIMAGCLGRKGALLMNNLLALFAATLMGASLPTGLFELLIIGRFLIGMNTGIGLSVQPLYIGESAPRHLRGAMVIGSSIFLTGGVLTGQVMGLRELLGGEEFWPFLLSSCGLPAIIQLLSLPWFPESPRFTLLDRGDETKGVKALKRFHGPLRYHKELEDIQRERFALQGEKAKKPWELFADRSIRWQLIAVICLTMGQQLSGINTIYFYASYVFAETGIPPEKIPYVTSDVCMGTISEHSLHIRLHLELWPWTRWCDKHFDDRIVHAVLTPCRLHYCRISELAELLHCWHALPLYCERPEAVLLHCVFARMRRGGHFHFLCHSRDKEQNLSRN
ncbi:solute carrier family 2, facilitated glucose transporter member 11-like isoform X6 [Ahaetulla prasina]|uniref:solute carrier family 2, facilitated glucose transporter member 11-like isoform X6 n=1 Tax=Ahaetulla prasina TaxID=499056 RepID=UPI00264811DE|nr:solute carrier family 2, facilitated glucose transporter member 11-like isoform X6 [Ahaetulla prasina]